MSEEIPDKEAIKFLPPFPTVLIACGGEDDDNLITVSMIHVFSLDPPMIGIGISPKRHSYSLLEKIPEFTVNVPPAGLIEEIQGCGSVSSRYLDKFEEFDLNRSSSIEVSPSGVKECPLILECEISEKIDAGDHRWFIGPVVHTEKEEGLDREDMILYWGGEFRKPGDLIE